MVELKVRLIYKDKNQLNNIIRKYAIQNSHDIKFVKNDNIRIKAICNEDECYWFLYAYKSKNDS